MKQLLILLALIIFSGCTQVTPKTPVIKTPVIKTPEPETPIVEEIISEEIYTPASYNVLLKSGRFVHNKRIYRIKKSKTVVTEGTNTLVQITMRKRGRTIKKDASIYIDGDTVVFELIGDNYFSKSKRITFRSRNDWKGTRNHFLINRVLSSKDAVANLRVTIKRL